MWVNHCHLLPPGAFDNSDPTAGTLARWEQVATRLGIERAVAFAPFTYQMTGDPNKWLAATLEDQANLLRFVTIHPLKAGAAEELRHYIEEKEFDGAKLHPAVMKFRIDDEAADAFYATAEQLGIPIVFHAGVHGWRLSQYLPILIDEVAERHPALTIIMAHVGGTAFFDQALAVLHNRKNVYAELAQARRKLRPYCWYLSDERIRALIDTVGPERMIYGCDWPWNPEEHIARDIEWVQSWDITDAEKQLILGGNLKRILRCS